MSKSKYRGFSIVGFRKFNTNKDFEDFVADRIGDVAGSLSRVNSRVVNYYIFARNICWIHLYIRVHIGISNSVAYLSTATSSDLTLLFNFFFQFYINVILINKFEILSFLLKPKWNFLLKTTPKITL